MMDQFFPVPLSPSYPSFLAICGLVLSLSLGLSKRFVFVYVYGPVTGPL